VSFEGSLLLLLMMMMMIDDDEKYTAVAAGVGAVTRRSVVGSNTEAASRAVVSDAR